MKSLSITYLLFLLSIVTAALIGHYLWKPVLVLSGVGLILNIPILGFQYLNLAMLGLGMFFLTASFKHLGNVIQTQISNANLKT